MTGVNDYSDEAVQEIHDEMYRREEDRPKSGIAGFDQRTKFFIGLVVAGLIWLLWTERITFQQGLIGFILGAIVLFIMKGTDSTRKELTWLECMIRLNDLLTFLQNHPIGDVPQIPKGEVHITPIGRKQWYEGRPFKRGFGIEIYEQDTDTTEIFYVELDVFTGDIITFQHKPQGVIGDETKDIKIMPTYDMFINKKREQYLSRGYGRR